PKLHSRPKQNFVSSSLITRSAHIAIRQWPLTDHKLDEVFGKQEWFKNRNALQKYCESITIFSLGNGQPGHPKIYKSIREKGHNG
ncbi:hypothetical protein DERF_009904, partial [Dermatophagoides farinae]